MFEKRLYYHDCWVQYRFQKDSLDGAHSQIKDLQHLLKKLIKRKGFGFGNVPKFHELTHVVRDIRRHGPAIMYDLCITEGHHHDQKLYARSTNWKSIV